MRIGRAVLEDDKGGNSGLLLFVTWLFRACVCFLSTDNSCDLCSRQGRVGYMRKWEQDDTLERWGSHLLNCDFLRECLRAVFSA